MSVGVVEGVGGLARDPKRVGDRELPLARQALPQGLAVHERHREPELAVGVARVEHGENVRVLEPGREPDLSEEPLGAERPSELGVQDLEGDGAVVAEVVRAVDRRHAAAAELGVETVAAGEGLRESGLGVGQQ
jgi:hypothetical protein